MHSKMGPVWQNPIQRTVRTACLSVLMTVHSKMCPVWQNPIQRTVRTACLSVLMTVHSFSTQ